jgi:hypothetical protein
MPVAATEIELPVFAPVLDAVQRRELTTHSSTCPAAQVTAAEEHDPAVDTTPLLHVEDAEPTVGADESFTPEVVPCAPPG